MGIIIGVLLLIILSWVVSRAGFNLNLRWLPFIARVGLFAFILAIIFRLSSAMTASQSMYGEVSITSEILNALSFLSMAVVVVCFIVGLYRFLFSSRSY